MKDQPNFTNLKQTQQTHTFVPATDQASNFSTGVISDDSKPNYQNTTSLNSQDINIQGADSSFKNQDFINLRHGLDPITKTTYDQVGGNFGLGIGIRNDKTNTQEKSSLDGTSNLASTDEKESKNLFYQPSDKNFPTITQKTYPYSMTDSTFKSEPTTSDVKKHNVNEKIQVSNQTEGFSQNTTSLNRDLIEMDSLKKKINANELFGDYQIPEISNFNIPMSTFFTMAENISKTFIILSGIKLKIFDTLEAFGNEFISSKDLYNKLGFKTDIRHFYDLLDNLYVHGYLEREGILEDSKYKNTLYTYKFFCHRSPENYVHIFLNLFKYMKKFINMEKEFPTSSYMTYYDDLKDDEEIKGMIDYFNRTNEKNYEYIISNIDFSEYKRIVDLRANNGILAEKIKKKFPQCSVSACDIKQNNEFIKEKLKGNEIFDSVIVLSGNIVKDEIIPTGDFYILPHLLMQFNCENKKKILSKIFNKIEKNGKVMIIENLIDEDRKDISKHTLIMSFILGIENYQGYAIAESEYKKLLAEIGFTNFEKIACANGISDIITVTKEF